MNLFNLNFLWFFNELQCTWSLVAKNKLQTAILKPPLKVQVHMAFNADVFLQVKAKATASSSTSPVTLPPKRVTFSTAGLWRHHGFPRWPTLSTATGWTLLTRRSSRCTRRRCTSITCRRTIATWESSEKYFQYSNRRPIVRFDFFILLI